MKRLLISFFLCLSVTAIAQNYDEIANLKTGDFEDQSPSISGLWAVAKVSVGDEELTPTAKWFQLNADGSQFSGNGWVQNFKGTWKFDAAANTFLSVNDDGSPDEYGAFKVVMNADEMTWTRNEEGMTVKVSLYRVDEKPLAPWDKIVGNWTAIGLKNLNTETGKGSVTDLEEYSYYFGWDRRYRKYDSAGKRTEMGIWHIEPHSDWLWLIPYGDAPKQGQEIKFDEHGMLLTTKEGAEVEEIRFEKGN